VNTIIGAGKTTGLLTYTSGDYPRFGNLIVNIIPAELPRATLQPGGIQPSAVENTYVLRSNPLQYNCIVGPNFINLDATCRRTSI